MNKSLGLINYEGDCLKAIKENGTIIVKDQYGKVVLSTDTEGLYAFIDGTQSITDSKGKVWEYLKEHENAKPSHLKIHEFLKDIN
jgi:hypothetical protein